MGLFSKNSAALIAVATIVLIFIALSAWGVSQSKKSPSPITKPSSLVTVPTEVQHATTTVRVNSTEKLTYKYIEITNSCGPYYQGVCVNMRSGPGEEYDVVERLRNGVVFQVSDKVTHNGEIWYKIKLDDQIRYPERVTSDWYVSADNATLFDDEGVKDAEAGKVYASTKRIEVDMGNEILTAYDGDTLFMKQRISTGLYDTPTPRGTFTVYRKTPSRYMQGPVPGVSDQYYDLPGVPWNLYFTEDGAVIHGAFWHDHFGEPWSHGCVNLSPANAKTLYEWADVGTKVIVHD